MEENVRPGFYSIVSTQYLVLSTDASVAVADYLSSARTLRAQAVVSIKNVVNYVSYDSL